MEFKEIPEIRLREGDIFSAVTITGLTEVRGLILSQLILNGVFC